MPAQFLLPGFGHQTQQFFFVGLKEFMVLPRDLFGSVRGPHSYERVLGPQFCDQPRKQSWVFGHKCGYLIRAADRPSISAFKERENVSLWHGDEPKSR